MTNTKYIHSIFQFRETPCIPQDDKDISVKDNCTEVVTEDFNEFFGDILQIKFMDTFNVERIHELRKTSKYKIGVFLQKFNVGLLIEPEDDHINNVNNTLTSTLTTFIGNPPNGLIMDCNVVNMIPIQQSSKIAFDDLVEWLNGVNAMMYKSLGELKVKTRKSGTDNDELREPPTTNIWLDCIQNTLRSSTVTETNFSYNLKTTVSWKNEKYAYHDSGTLISFLQMAAYIDTSMSAHNAFYQWAYERYQGMMSKSQKYEARCRIAEITNTPIVGNIEHVSSERSSNMVTNYDKQPINIYPDFKEPTQTNNTLETVYGIPTNSIQVEMTHKETLSTLENKINIHDKSADRSTFQYSQLFLQLGTVFFSIYDEAVNENIQANSIYNLVPILSDYTISIMNLTESLGGLQYTRPSDRETFLHLKNRFRKLEGGTISSKGSLLSMTQSDSFQVRYAQNSTTMSKWKNNKIKKNDRKISNKQKEIATKKEDYNRLKSKYDQMSCDYTYNHNNHNNHKIHARWCQKCTLNKDMNKIRVQVHESFLPTNTYEQLAVAFEHMIPDRIALLYDAIYVCYVYFNKTCVGDNDVYGDWGSNKRLRLYSHIKSFIQSHYSDKHIADVDSSGDNIIKPCGRVVVLGADDIPLAERFKQKFAYKGSSCYTTLNAPLHGSYEGLDNYILPFNEQNDVLARGDAPKSGITYNQYVNFCTLRSDQPNGRRLDLINSLTRMNDMDLDFNDRAITMSIEAIWLEMDKIDGPDWKCSEFQKRTVFTLDRFMDTIASNYVQTYPMFTHLVILERISHEMTNPPLALWRKTREIILKWKNETDEPIHALFHIITYPWIGGLTAELLHSIEMTYRYDLLDGTKNNYLEHCALKAIEQITEPYPKEELNRFLKDNYKIVHTGDWKDTGEWHYTDTYDNQRVEMNYRTGCFLLNRKPQNNLPPSIRNMNSYIRIFGKGCNPNTIPTKLGYQTISKDSNIIFEFIHNYSANSVVIIQKNIETSQQWRYVEPSELPKNLPYWFEKKSYVWSRCGDDDTRTILEFRSIAIDPTTSTHIFDNINNKPIVRMLSNGVSTDKILVLCDDSLCNSCIDSTLSIQETLDIHYYTTERKIQQKDFSNLTEEDITYVYMPRLKLEFNVGDDGTINCLTKNMIVLRRDVLTEQSLSNINIPCINIPQSCTLMNTHGDRFLIVPYGRVSSSKMKRIDLVVDKKDKYYGKYEVYRYRTDINMLWSDSNRQCDMYLSVLYGMFCTEHIGCELALRYLIRAWPVETYSDQELHIMKDISQLSPIREYYPKHLQNMESTVFPSGLDTVAASDQYALIADLFVRKNYILSGHTANISHLIDSKHYPLYCRAYLRSINHYSPLDEQIHRELCQSMVNNNMQVLPKSNDSMPQMSYSDIDSFAALSNIDTRTFDTDSELDTINCKDQCISLAKFASTCDSPFDRMVINYIIYKNNVSQTSALENRVAYTMRSLESSTDASFNIGIKPSKRVNKDDDVYENEYDGRINHKNYKYYYMYQSNRDMVCDDVKKFKSYYTTICDEFDRVGLKSSNFKTIEHSSTAVSLELSTIRNDLEKSHPWLELVSNIKRILSSAAIEHNCAELELWKNMEILLETFDATEKRYKSIQIKEEQIDIAKHLINSKTSIQTQLHMGKGKTSVIIPMITLAHLAHGTTPRVIVLDAMYSECQKLYGKLFGMMGMRLNTFACDRKYDLSRNLTEPHILLTTPSSILSFMNRLPQDSTLEEYAKYCKEEVCDIIDESDKILSVMNQLVYTHGKQQTLDGGKIVWLVIEAVLDAIKVDGVDEFPENWEHITEQLKNDDLFANRIVEKILIGGESCLNKDIVLDYTKTQYKETFDFIFKTGESNTEEIDCEDVTIQLTTNDSIDNSNTKDRDVIKLVLRGLFEHKILRNGLDMRYGVKYGVDLKVRGDMAVPFHARDVPTERSDFAHIHLCILLTCLSYYKTGLDGAQLKKVMDTVKSSSEGRNLYLEWTNEEWNDVFIDDANKDWSNIAKFTSVVNYYLNIFVFPHFTKEFPHKTIKSPWDLVDPTTHDYPVCGFSGTNGTCTLLPAPTIQDDLACTKDTNNQMDAAISRQKLSSCSVDRIIDKLVELDTKYFFDVGANIHESGFTHKWFRRMKDAYIQNNRADELQGVVFYAKGEHGDRKYFDGEVEYDYDSKDIDLERSCVFLDQFHTRGTNMKFPPNAIAVVSLAKNLMRDELAQGCMRLRMLMSDNLDERQSIVFLKPDNLTIPDDDVLKWANTNTIQKLKDHSYLWAIQAKTHYSDIKLERDSQSLVEKYYGNYEKFNLLDIITCPQLEGKDDVRKELTRRMSLIPTTSVSPSNLAEEQERELEKEMEAQYQVERPPNRDAHKFKFNKGLLIPKELLERHTVKQCEDSQERELSNIPFLKGMDYYHTFEFTKIYNDQIELSDIAMRPVQFLLIVNGSVILIHPQEACEILVRTGLSYEQAEKKFRLYSIAPRKRGNTQMITHIDAEENITRTINHPNVLDLAISSLYYKNPTSLATSIGLVPIGTSGRMYAKENNWIDDDGFGTLDGQPHLYYESSPMKLIKAYYDNKYEKFDGACKGTDQNSLFNLITLPKMVTAT